MLKRLLGFSFIAISSSVIADAQIVGSNVYLQGQYLEAGMSKNGSMGTTRNAPAGYHQRPGGTFTLYDPTTCTSASVGSSLSSVYDLGHDGWTTGTPGYMGDYTLPGTPFEGWAIQWGTTVNFAFFNNYMGSTGCSGFYASGSSTTASAGSFTSYSSVGGNKKAIWTGTAASGALSITKEYRLDTTASCLVITAIFRNTSATDLTNVYYFRSLDADNNETLTGGSFTTSNSIVYQNDFYHRVYATAAATGTSTATGTPANRIGLATKDCRAKCLIYTSWGFSTSYLLSNVWSESSVSAIGTSYFNGTVSGDYALGLVYNLGTIAAGDSTAISYAYVYDGVTGIDAAFPEPQFMYNGNIYDSIASDTVCSTADLPVNILHGNDKNWTWGEWHWAGPAGSLASDTGVNNTILVSALTGVTTFTITGTDSAMGNCATKTFLLTILPVSSPAPETRDTTYCQGIAAPPLSANATGTGLTYYTTPTGGVGTTVAPVPSTTTLGTFTYYISQVIAGCESPRTPVNITIAAPPIISLSNNGPLCPGDNLVITLSGTDIGLPGTIYSWSGPGGFSAASQNATITGVVYADSGVYTISVNNSGCISIASDTVIVHSTPPSPTFTNPTYCQYLPAVPLSATGSNILWYTSATGGTGSTTAPIPSTMVAGVFTYYVTQTINNCESARYPVTVTVNAKPPVPVITNNPGAYCPGQTFNTYTVVLGSNILWYNAGTGGSGSPTAPVVNTNIPGTYTYYASQTVLGCESDRTPVSVTVYDNVTSNYTYNVDFGCNGDTVSFSNASTGAINYLWDFGDGTSSNDPYPTHVYPTQGIYTIRLFSHSANCVDSNVQAIDLTHPVASAFTINPVIVCQGLPVDFIAMPTVKAGTTATYAWNFGDGHTATDSMTSNIYANTGTYNVMLVTSDFVPCSDTAYGTVYVDSTGPITMTVSDTAYCKGGHTTLTADYTNIGTTVFVWNFGNGDSIYNTNPVIYAYGTPGIYTVSGTVRYRACPEKTVTHVISVFDQPQLFVGDDFTICEGNTSVLLADNYNVATPGIQYMWSTGETTSSINVTTAGTYYVTANVGGCIATDSVTVVNDCSLAMINVFTPNGDGVNDYFNPRLYLGEGLKVFHMTIFNRWGQNIFETKALDGRGWDGYFNGILQPEEVYVYMIEAVFIDGKQLKKNGNVTLLR